MHVILSTESFKDRLDLVAKMSMKHVTLPVLQCVLLEVKDGVMSLKATNLELGIEATLSPTIEEEGVIAVPAQTLLQTVALHKDKNITLRSEGESLVVEGGGSNTQIKSIAHEEFPRIPQLREGGQVINGESFVLGIKTTAFAASQSSIKPELSSICVFQRKEHSLTFVATDSFRLVEKTTAQNNVVLEEQLLIPQKNALELAKVFDVLKGKVEMVVSENQIAFVWEDGVYLTSRLTSGSFPDYERVIPKEFSTTAKLLKGDLVHAFRKTQIFLNNFSQVKLITSNDSLTLSATSTDVGNTTESIKAEVDGEEVMLSFNQRYVSDPLTHIAGDSIQFRFGVDRKLLIEAVGNQTFRYLVMPMNK